MEKIFYSGNILTMDENNPKVEAVFVKNGKIVSVGNYEEIVKNKTDNTEMVDLKGNTMFPGFFEPHLHLELAGMMGASYLIGGLYYDKAEDVLNEIKKAVLNTPKGEWIFCYGLDYLLNRDLPTIDRYYLDELTKEHPLFLILQSMHTVYANSYALELIGINKDTKDTRDGHCYKDENGEPTGVLTEQTFSMMFVRAWFSSKNISPEELIIGQTKKYKEKGITTAWTAGNTPIFPDHDKLMVDILSKEECPIRSDYAITYNVIEKGQDLALLPKDTEKSKFTGIKLWYDGSPYTGNMYMYDNYLENDIMQNKLFVPTNQAGETLFKGDSFYELIEKYHNLGYQISVHSQGDRSCHEVINAYERVLTKYPRKDHRHRLEHCAFITKEDIKRCADLGIEISFHINHIYYYGQALVDLVVGEERANKMMPTNTVIANGGNFTLHSDDPMYQADPLSLVCTAVTRKDKNSLVLGIDEAVSVHDAMKAVTINSARQTFRDKELGTIEPGKYADFTVLKQSPYDVDKEEIRNIEVVTTYLSGTDTNTLA